MAGDKYAWQVTGGTIVGATNTNSITVAWGMPGIGSVTLRQTSSFGCDSTVSKPAIQIMRTPAPVITGPDSTCQNKKYTYSVPSVTGDSYNWQVSGGTIIGSSTGSSVLVAWGNPGAGKIEVVQTSSFGCDSMVQRTIRVMRTPAPVIAGADSGCQNKKYVYSVTAVAGDKYAWQVTGGTIVGAANTNSITVAWGMPGIGSVTIRQTSGFGCDSVVSKSAIQIMRICTGNCRSGYNLS